MKKIDLHLHLSFDPVPKSDTLLVSTYKEMLPHLEELGIGKGEMCIRDRGYRSTKKFTNSEKLKVFLQAIPCLFMIVVVIGGIISGIFTATEAVSYTHLASIFSGSL